MTRALLVEDDSSTATLVQGILKLRRIGVDVVSSGEHAIRALEANAYDHVIVDLILPRVDGFTIIEYIKAARPDLLSRIIVVSGAPPSELQRLDLTAYRAFLPKPLVVENLLELLQ